MIFCIHMGTVGATENEKTSREGRVGEAPPTCSMHASKWEGMVAFMPARGGGEVAMEWKEGPL